MLCSEWRPPERTGNGSRPTLLIPGSPHQCFLSPSDPHLHPSPRHRAIQAPCQGLLYWLWVASSRDSWAARASPRPCRGSSSTDIDRYDCVVRPDQFQACTLTTCFGLIVLDWHVLPVRPTFRKEKSMAGLSSVPGALQICPTSVDSVCIRTRHKVRHLGQWL